MKENELRITAGRDGVRVEADHGCRIYLRDGDFFAEKISKHIIEFVNQPENQTKDLGDVCVTTEPAP